MSNNETVFPTPLKLGDIFRIISPAGPIEDEEINRCRDLVEGWGYRVQFGKYTFAKDGYFAGRDQDRLSDLMGALLDDNVKAVICSRGGYGSARITKLIEWSELEHIAPKFIVGFSDIGALLINITQRLNWVVLSGPQARAIAGDITDYSLNHLHGFLEGHNRNLDIKLEPVRSGIAKGRIIACCLSVLVSLIGTPIMPNLDDSILCIEDINEPPYRIDRLLWQLKESGAVSNINALVLGKFIANNSDYNSAVIRIALDIFKDMMFPIYAGLPWGHFNDTITIPIGSMAVIDSNSNFSLCQL